MNIDQPEYQGLTVKPGSHILQFCHPFVQTVLELWYHLALQTQAQCLGPSASIVFVEKHEPHPGRKVAPQGFLIWRPGHALG